MVIPPGSEKRKIPAGKETDAHPILADFLIVMRVRAYMRMKEGDKIGRTKERNIKEESKKIFNRAVGSKGRGC